MGGSEIRSFRKTLRQFEMLLDGLIKESCCCCGVTIAQCHALLEIEENGQTTTVGLAKSLGLDKSTLSRTVDGLVNIGLVERIPHPTDRRYTLITLSEQGRKICKEINRVNDDYFERVFQAFQDAERAEVIRYFDLLVKTIADHNQHAGKGAVSDEPQNEGEDDTP